MSEWIDRDAALAMLGIRAQSLYAYVSRGLIERRADADDPRRSAYRAADVAAIVARRARGRKPQAIARSAFAWGEASLPTELSTVRHGQLIYRGRDAVALADTATLEEVAGLLWEAAPPAFAVVPASDDGPAMALARLADRDAPMLGRSRAAWMRDAAMAVAALAASLGATASGAALHHRLAARWGLDASGTDLVRRALVLLADHELNPSTFATRVAAATGGAVAAAMLAGLGALSGPRHGGAGAATARLARDAQGDVTAALADWLARDHPLPGFGHPLYPGGDPRAAALLARIALPDDLADLRDAVAGATGARPNIDFALLALTRAARLPDDAPFRLFAIGRSVGWAAHAMEQVASGHPIRPRAIYRGPLAD